MKRQSPQAQSGFSLLEVIIAVSVLAIMAGVISLRSGAVLEKARAAKAIRLANTLKTACTAYRADTGLSPTEFGGFPASWRHLSATQTFTGWSGPYLEAPLTTTGTNPFGGSAYLLYQANAYNLVSGFDLDGDGTDDVTSSGNSLLLTNVEEQEAKRVNDIWDAGIPGDWKNTGRIRYRSDYSFLMILVYL